MILHLDDFCSCCFRQQIKFMVLGKMMAITAQHILISEDFGEVTKYWDAWYKQAYGRKKQFLSLMIISTGIRLLPYNISFFFIFPANSGSLQGPQTPQSTGSNSMTEVQAIWSPQHQHQHLMDRWHLCRVAGMKRALLHFFVSCNSATV